MVFKCKMCGHIYDESVEGVLFVKLPQSWTCPICGAPKSLFEPIEQTVPDDKPVAAPTVVPVRSDLSFIQAIANLGTDIIEPAGTDINITDWSEILMLGAQLATKPLDETVSVNTKTVIGPNAKHPLEIDTPIVVSHMSYGALTAEHKIAIAKGAAAVGTSVGSGEGGILPDELAAAHKYIFEYVPNLYSVTDENLLKVDAVEIKIGQSAKPGMGGHLPGAKVTAEIAALRGRPEGQDIISPSAFADINKPSDLKVLVESLRERSDGRPIGIKIAANNIEADMEWILGTGADFMTIDGRGGGTGAAPTIWRDTAGVPTLYAVLRARKILDAAKSEMTLIVTGGLRTGADFAKCLALGADVVAVATGVLTALAAPGDLPAEQKVANYLRVSNEEIQMMARAMGHDDIHKLSLDDVVTTSQNIATYTPIRHT